MGLAASPVEHRAENYGDGNRDARSRKRLVMVMSAAAASVVMVGVIVAGAAMFNYEPTRQHVEVQLKCDSEPCKVSAR